MSNKGQDKILIGPFIETVPVFNTIGVIWRVLAVFHPGQTAVP